MLYRTTCSAKMRLSQPSLGCRFRILIRIYARRASALRARTFIRLKRAIFAGLENLIKILTSMINAFNATTLYAMHSRWNESAAEKQYKILDGWTESKRRARQQRRRTTSLHLRNEGISGYAWGGRQDGGFKMCKNVKQDEITQTNE